jgi:hypothetical protein
MLLVLGIVPHHHHDGAVCMVMERCEKDNSVNDEHTNHHPDEGMKQGQSCVADGDFYAFLPDSRIKCSTSFCDNCDNHAHFFSILYLFADFLTHPEENISIKSEYGEYIAFYTSAEASQFHSLRAPPYMLF